MSLSNSRFSDTQQSNSFGRWRSGIAEVVFGQRDCYKKADCGQDQVDGLVVVSGVTGDASQLPISSSQMTVVLGRHLMRRK